MSSNVISIKTNFPAVVSKLNQVADDIGNKAMVRALNATITQGHTLMARTISQEFRITRGEAKERLDVTRASSKGGVYIFHAELMASGKSGIAPKTARGMNLINFVKTRPKRTKKGKLGQVRLQIKRTGGTKHINGAFIATNRKTGGEALFVRDGNKRMPIRTLTTIDVPQMFNTKRINEVVRSVMLSRFETNFNRELRVVLGGFLK